MTERWNQEVCGPGGRGRDEKGLERRRMRKVRRRRRARRKDGYMGTVGHIDVHLLTDINKSTYSPDLDSQCVTRAGSFSLFPSTITHLWPLQIL